MNQLDLVLLNFQSMNSLKAVELRALKFHSVTEARNSSWKCLWTQCARQIHWVGWATQRWHLPELHLGTKISASLARPHPAERGCCSCQGHTGLHGCSIQCIWNQYSGPQILPTPHRWLESEVWSDLVKDCQETRASARTANPAVLLLRIHQHDSI